MKVAPFEKIRFHVILAVHVYTNKKKSDLGHTGRKKTDSGHFGLLCERSTSENLSGEPGVM